MKKTQLQAAYDALLIEASMLRAEVAAHRAHVCLPAPPVCTCAMGGLTTLRCPVHQPDVTWPVTFTGYVNPGNVCGPGVPVTLWDPAAHMAGVRIYPEALTQGAAAQPLPQYFSAVL